MTEHTLDPQRQEQAREYSSKMRWLFFLEVALTVVFLLAVLLSGLSGAMRDFLDIVHPARVAAYCVIILLGYTIVSAPLTVYGGFILPRRYGLSHQKWGAWLADEAKEGVLGFVLGTGIIVVIYICLQSFPQIWWLLASAFMIISTVVITGLAPVLILPLFFKLEPLSDAALRQRLLALAKRCQTDVRDVFQINLSSKTPAGNAMLMGWGGTRRIAIGDTLLQKYTPEEIEVIMAHELGHHRHRDVARLITAQAALFLIGFYLSNIVLQQAIEPLGMNGISDVAALPLLILVLGAISLLLSPLLNAYIKYREEAADKYALDITQNPEAFISMITRLTDQNMGESEPGRWTELLFYDHPPYYKRLALAQSAKREKPA